MKVDVYWINVSRNIRLAIMPRPRARDWLEDELLAWKREGVDVIVSLLTLPEERELGLQNEKEVSARLGLMYLSFPILDRQTPRSFERVRDLVNQVNRELELGQGVAIHCRMGVGRSAMLSACVLVSLGLGVDEAFCLIRAARGLEVPDTVEQVAWVRQFERLLMG